MPSKTKLVTPSAKITEPDTKKLKYISDQLNTSQSKVLQNLIRDEYKRLKKAEKDGFEIL